MKSTVKETNPKRRQLMTESAAESEISARAYQLWEERGCPVGSPEIDWRRAQEEYAPTEET